MIDSLYKKQKVMDVIDDVLNSLQSKATECSDDYSLGKNFGLMQASDEIRNKFRGIREISEEEIYEKVLKKHIMEDLTEYTKNKIALSPEDIELIAHKYIEGGHNKELSYWDNLDNLIEDHINNYEMEA